MGITKRDILGYKKVFLHLKEYFDGLLNDQAQIKPVLAYKEA